MWICLAWAVYSFKREIWAIVREHIFIRMREHHVANSRTKVFLLFILTWAAVWMGPVLLRTLARDLQSQRLYITTTGSLSTHQQSTVRVQTHGPEWRVCLLYLYFTRKWWVHIFLCIFDKMGITNKWVNEESSLLGHNAVYIGRYRSDHRRGFRLIAYSQVVTTISSYLLKVTVIIIHK
jgi:hypothetical protein